MMMQEVLEDLNNELGEINDDIVPEEKEESTKNVFTGKDFKKLTKKAKKLGAKSLDYSSRKNN